MSSTGSTSAISAAMSVALLAIGLWVFRAAERQVLKEI